MSEIISREDAKRSGLPRYFTGQPCRHGHVAPRLIGRSNECTACKSARDQKYTNSRKTEKSAYDRSRRIALADSLAQQKAAYRAENREKLNTSARAARAADPQRFKAYKEKRAELRNEEAKQWRERNKDRVAQYSKEYEARRMSEDLRYRLAVKLRQRLATAVREGAKGGSAVRDLGCTLDELRAQLEAKFQPGMNWDNWGRKGWHIDHIRPLSAFDLTDPEQAREACHFSNLQPLWWIDNLRKGAAL